LPKNSEFIKEDIRNFRTDKRFDLITLYGVANSFDKSDISKIYHMCYGLLKTDGKLLVKHQCGRIEDVFVDKFSDKLNSDYCAYYHSVKNHQKMLRQAGFDFDTIDPYPLDRNKWENTEFKAFICKRTAPILYTEYFPKARQDETEWFAMHKRRESVPRSNDAKWELLKTIKTHLDANDIPFHLMFGTLLGAVRDGDFIEWDGDVDVAILGRFQNRLMKVLDEIPLKLWRIQDYACSLVYEDEFVDIYTYTEEDKYSYCGGAKRFFDEDKDVFDNPSKVMFKGLEFLTVKDPVSSLRRWYGDDWTTPKKLYWESFF